MQNKITIKTTLQQATTDLKPVTTIPQLEAELLLTSVLRVSRADLWACLTDTLESKDKQAFNHLIARRLKHEPIAYLIGSKEFWDFRLRVTPAVLIPRADTELLVTQCLQHLPSDHPSIILELGTGSGAIALAIARECRQSQVIAVDKSSDALAIAKENAESLNVSTITFLEGHWFDVVTHNAFDLIVSNPPYIAIDDPALEEAVKLFEPSMAYFAEENGLADIKEIVSQAPQYLKENGWLIIEHGYQQGAVVRDLFKSVGLIDVETVRDLNELDRVTLGRK